MVTPCVIGTIEDDFVMPTTYYDDHDWVDTYDISYDLKIYLSLVMNQLLITLPTNTRGFVTVG